MSYFDRLLEKIEDADARLKLTSVVQGHPEVSRWIVDPATVEKAAQVTEWSRNFWDEEHDMTKAEYMYSQKVQDLESQIAQGHGNMTFEELNSKLDEYAASKGLMSQDQVKSVIQEKESEFARTLNAVSAIATKIPYLNQKHQNEFGEMFDPDAFLTKANEAQARDLDSFYRDYTAEKREAKQKADFERQLAEAKDQGKREALQAQTMGQDGQMPTLDAAPEIGHFQRSFMKMADPAQASAVPVNAELGKGQIARAAAHAGDMAAFAGRVN